MSSLDRNLTGGPGASVLSTAFGKIVRFRRGGGAGFDHPWQASFTRATLERGGATFRQGVVNGRRATIGGVPLDGVMPDSRKLSAPVLQWNNLMLDADGIGYLCVECTFASPEKEGAWNVLTAEMAQVADPNTDTGMPDGLFHMASGGARPLAGFRARWPVAMIQARDGGRLDLFQIVYFNLNHRAALKADGKSAQRHFFF